MFLSDWQRELPQVTTFAARGLSARRQVRAARIHIDRELGEATPEEWRADLEAVSVNAPMFSEIELFDKRSRTLILTDLVQNLDPDDLSASNEAAANLLGISSQTERRRSISDCCCASAAVPCGRQPSGSYGCRRSG